jgi:hypothetical protein
VVIWGVKTVSGTFLAGITFALFPLLESDYSPFKYLVYLGTGLAAIGIGRNPNGVMGGNTPLEGYRRRRDQRLQGPLPPGKTVSAATEVSHHA